MILTTDNYKGCLQMTKEEQIAYDNVRCLSCKEIIPKYISDVYYNALFCPKCNELERLKILR